jgi:hypothetical protein
MDTFQKDIEWLLESHHILEVFQNQNEFHVRFDMPGFDRLVIERYDTFVSVAHYFEQNGDLIADPEVEFQYPSWFPTAITQVIGGRREKCIERNGQKFVVKNFHNEVTSFLVLWGNNIRAQGWDRASSSITSNAEVAEEEI